MEYAVARLPTSEVCDSRHRDVELQGASSYSIRSPAKIPSPPTPRFIRQTFFGPQLLVTIPGCTIIDIGSRRALFGALTKYPHHGEVIPTRSPRTRTSGSAVQLHGLHVVYAGPRSLSAAARARSCLRYPGRIFHASDTARQRIRQDGRTCWPRSQQLQRLRMFLPVGSGEPLVAMLTIDRCANCTSTQPTSCANL